LTGLEGNRFTLRISQKVIFQQTLAASERFAINFSLSSGAANDSPQGMRLLYFTPPGKQKQYLLMDRAYSGKKMRKTAVELGYVPVVPPKQNSRNNGNMTRGFTSNAMRLSDSFFVD